MFTLCNQGMYYSCRRRSYFRWFLDTKLSPVRSSRRAVLSGNRATHNQSISRPNQIFRLGFEHKFIVELFQAGMFTLCNQGTYYSCRKRSYFRWFLDKLKIRSLTSTIDWNNWLFPTSILTTPHRKCLLGPDLVGLRATGTVHTWVVNSGHRRIKTGNWGLYFYYNDIDLMEYSSGDTQ